jgi:hypothetical protein
MTDTQKFSIKSLKQMMDSCFAYGTIEKDSYQYQRFILPFEKEMGKRLFNKVYKEHAEYLSKCTVKQNVYTDCEGLNYNSIIKPEGN